jgi:hypothetical protein
MEGWTGIGVEGRLASYSGKGNRRSRAAGNCVGHFLPPIFYQPPFTARPGEGKGKRSGVKNGGRILWPNRKQDGYSTPKVGNLPACKITLGGTLQRHLEKLTPHLSILGHLVAAGMFALGSLAFGWWAVGFGAAGIKAAAGIVAVARDFAVGLAVSAEEAGSQIAVEWFQSMWLADMRAVMLDSLHWWLLGCVGLALALSMWRNRRMRWSGFPR